MGSAARVSEAAGESGIRGLVGYWSFDEGQGTDTAANVVRNAPGLFGSTGTASLIEAAWVEGKLGKALDFAAGKSFALIDKTPELNCGDQLTIAAWIRIAQPENRALIINHEYAYRLSIAGKGKARVHFQLNLNGDWAGNWLISQSTLTPGTWHYVAGVYDGRERRIYIDGKLDATEVISGNIAMGQKFSIGGAALAGRGTKRVFKLGQSKAIPVREAFPGVIDEVKIWSRALSAADLALAAAEAREQVLAQLPRETALSFYSVKSVAMATPDSDAGCELAVFNGSDKAYQGTLSVTVSHSDGGGQVHAATHPLSISSGKKISLPVQFPAATPGSYTLRVARGDFELFSMPILVLEPISRAPQGDLKLKKVLQVDLGKDLDADRFCDDDNSRIVSSDLGDYREAGPEMQSRFVVRLPLRRSGLHLVRVSYPDDKARTCEIASWSPSADDRYNIHSGYFTGDPYPLSMKMQTVEFVIWARDTDQALAFTSWLEDQPAAAVEVFEIEGQLPSSAASHISSQRFIGQYWEDAQPLTRCFGGGAPNLIAFDKVVQNLCDYFDYSGQNLLMHPAVWYEGPIYNSLVEKRGGKGGFFMPTDGWIDIMLKRFEERGFKFYALFNTHQLPSLIDTMQADPEAVAAGAPTFNTVSKDGDVSIKTWHHRMSIYNALHPHVQNRVLALVEELADRYGDSPAFGGVGFHLTLASLLQPGSLEVSYDDWTVAAFEKDTGIQVPVKRVNAERFGERYQWITAHANDEWIRWRCKRMAAYYGEAASILRKRRKDLQLVITILEPPMQLIDPQRLAWMNGKRLVEQAREAGIDPDLLARHPGIVIQQSLSPSAQRSRLTFGLDRGRWGAPPPDKKSIAAIRGMDLDGAQQRDFRVTDSFGVFLYNRYFESAIGERKPLKSDWYGGIPLSTRRLDREIAFPSVDPEIHRSHCITLLQSLHHPGGASLDQLRNIRQGERLDVVTQSGVKNTTLTVTKDKGHRMFLAGDFGFRRRQQVDRSIPCQADVELVIGLHFLRTADNRMIEVDDFHRKRPPFVMVGFGLPLFVMESLLGSTNQIAKLAPAFKGAAGIVNNHQSTSLFDEAQQVSLGFLLILQGFVILEMQYDLIKLEQLIRG